MYQSVVPDSVLLQSVSSQQHLEQLIKTTKYLLCTSVVLVGIIVIMGLLWAFD